MPRARPVVMSKPGLARGGRERPRRRGPHGGVGRRELAAFITARSSLLCDHADPTVSRVARRFHRSRADDLRI